MRLPLYLIIHSLNFRNRIAHVVLMAKKERVCSEIKPLSLLMEGDDECAGGILMDKI